MVRGLAVIDAALGWKKEKKKKKRRKRKEKKRTTASDTEDVLLLVSGNCGQALVCVATTSTFVPRRLLTGQTWTFEDFRPGDGKIHLL